MVEQRLQHGRARYEAERKLAGAALVVQSVWRAQIFAAMVSSQAADGPDVPDVG